MIRLLDWDTAWFGFPVARVEGERLNAEGVEEACRAAGVRVAYFLADLEPANVRAAEDAGWRRVDTRLDFARVASGDATLEATRPGRPGDLDALAPVASAGYVASRFFADPRFDPARCAAMYVEWLRGALANHFVAVAEHAGRPAAYATLEGDRIGLVGVAEAARGRGLGERVVLAAVAEAARTHARIEVGTQARNIAAQRLYQRCGFLSQRARGWYHRWFD